MTMSRRELLGWFRRPVADEPKVVEAPVVEPAAAFSLDAFYANRDADRTIPAFAVRTTVTAETTPTGAGPAHAASAGVVDTEAPRIAPELVPEVIASRCLATRSFCSVCVERCPRPGAIIVELGRPRVVAAQCDGCGRCVSTCPAPVLAFKLVAR